MFPLIFVIVYWVLVKVTRAQSHRAANNVSGLRIGEEEAPVSGYNTESLFVDHIW